MKLDKKERLITIYISSFIGIIIGSTYMVSIAYDKKTILLSLIWSIFIGNVIGYTARSIGEFLKKYSYTNLKVILLANFITTGSLTSMCIFVSGSRSFLVISIFALIAITISSIFIIREHSIHKQLNSKLEEKQNELKEALYQAN